MKEVLLNLLSIYLGLGLLVLFLYFTEYRPNKKKYLSLPYRYTPNSKKAISRSCAADATLWGCFCFILALLVPTDSKFSLIHDNYLPYTLTAVIGFTIYKIVSISESKRLNSTLRAYIP